MLGLELSGGILEAALELGKCKEQPLIPHKGKSLYLKAVVHRAEQFLWVSCHLSLVQSVSSVCFVLYVSCLSPLRGLSETLGSAIAACDLCIHQPGSGAIKPWTQEL